MDLTQNHKRKSIEREEWDLKERHQGVRKESRVSSDGEREAETGE
jgi:hypothetical protein